MGDYSTNVYHGTVASIDATSIVTEVVLSIERGCLISSLVTSESCERFSISEGDTVTATISPFDVVIKKGQCKDIDLRNYYDGKILSVYIVGTTVEVLGSLCNGMLIKSFMTNSIIGDLDFKANDTVCFFFSPYCVILSPDDY